jgi:hypothetical protein
MVLEERRQQAAAAGKIAVLPKESALRQRIMTALRTFNGDPKRKDITPEMQRWQAVMKPHMDEGTVPDDAVVFNNVAIGGTYQDAKQALLGKLQVCALFVCVCVACCVCARASPPPRGGANCPALGAGPGGGGAAGGSRAKRRRPHQQQVEEKEEDAEQAGRAGSSAAEERLPRPRSDSKRRRR